MTYDQATMVRSILAVAVFAVAEVVNAGVALAQNEGLAGPAKVDNPGFPYSVPGSFLTASRLYRPDAHGYWQGPIWGRSTLLAVEGLRACGEDALADEIALKFCKLVMKSGFSENYDAKTGAALCDPAYTCPAASFLVLAHELHLRQGRQARAPRGSTSLD